MGSWTACCVVEVRGFGGVEGLRAVFVGCWRVFGGRGACLRVDEACFEGDRGPTTSSKDFEACVLRAERRVGRDSSQTGATPATSPNACHLQNRPIFELRCRVHSYDMV